MSSIMPLNIRFYPEEDGSITVDLNLDSYMPLFLRANGRGEPLNSSEREEFATLNRTLRAYFQEIEASDLFMDVQTACLSRFTAEEQQALRQSPAINSLQDSLQELFKNSIDAFLAQKLADPDANSNSIKANFNIEKFHDEVFVTYADSGPGFSNAFIERLSDEEQQLAFMNSAHISEKRGGGFLGGAGRGLRELIHQVLTGEMMRKGTKKTQRSRDFESSIQFSNHRNHYCDGACIEISSQIAPALAHVETIRTTPDSVGPESSGSDQTAPLTGSEASDSGLHAENKDSSKRKKGLQIEMDPIDTSCFQGLSPDPNIKQRDYSKYRSYSPIEHRVRQPEPQIAAPKKSISEHSARTTVPKFSKSAAGGTSIGKQTTAEKNIAFKSKAKGRIPGHSPIEKKSDTKGSHVPITTPKTKGGW